jgi:DNA-binding response OmpR family regulator
MFTPNTQPEIPHKQVLVVEDHEDTALLLTMLLEDEGYQATRAGTAEAAIKACCTTPTANGKDLPPHVDLVLLDLNLPDMEYTEMVRCIAGCHRTPSQIIVLSAMPDTQMRAAAQAIGAAATIRKPFSPDALLERINKILALSPTT